MLIFGRPTKDEQGGIMIAIFWDYSEFESFFFERAEKLALVTEDCSLSELAPDWIVDEDSLRRPDGEFFKVRGRKVTSSGGHNVRRWKQPMIFQPSGTVACVFDDGTNLFLVRCLAEPGSIGLQIAGQNTRVLVAPSLQFSPGQLELHRRAERGEVRPDGEPYKPTPLAGVISGDRFKARWEVSNEDPGRFAEKVNRIGLIHIPSLAALDHDLELMAAEAQANFAWVSLEVLRVIRVRGLMNSHLRSVMAMLV